MAERAPLPEVRALVGALERARRHGAPLADTLAAQARDARFALARHAREEAARAGPKIQLVVALLLVPVRAPARRRRPAGGAARRTAESPARPQQLTIRWNERLACVPVLSRVTTRTPFTLEAADVTAI